ncbi:Nitrogen assimilation transcription factor nit-4 [Conoideocrella luteorostrata]|uniref:Nitrogen assimilation transcription factor nit-4 n=1 Tax=Conoideocrella luteorostrata TaxID=1105319 RepID=A0AAJ0FSV7_9HYPO|nr:Nitrogen assimilation transcription factor nit-4 [Conoideocrella luteorostrata]
MAGSSSRNYQQSGQQQQQHSSMASLGASGYATTDVSGNSAGTSVTAAARKKARRRADSSSQKRRCISTACIACRKRKSKCDGALPSCAACASVYGTECIYDPNSDHRRKGVYREKADGVKARGTTLQVLVEAILNASEDDVSSVVNKIRSCDNLDSVAESIINQDPDSEVATPEEATEDYVDFMAVRGEKELARKMGELRFENGSVRFIGGTSHLIYLGDSHSDAVALDPQSDQQLVNSNPIVSWTKVTGDVNLITHLINMYFNYHFTYFTTLSKKLFFRDFMQGLSSVASRNSTTYCSPLLVNAMLALGCHFTDIAGAYGTPGDARTKGDHFFAEAKRLILDDDEFAKPRLVTVQALALMSVREAGCGREAKGWVYSGMSFRMAQDIGLNLEISGADRDHMSEEEIDARKITYWGCFVFDKCWSNYLGRLPQLPKASCNISKFDAYPEEDAAMWSPLTDRGFDEAYELPSRTRSAALQLASLCEISSDLLVFFYHPNHIGRSRGKSIELKKLSEIHQRLEQWRKALPREFEPTDGQLPNIILMHMFFHLQYIHLFRPFLKYTPAASPLPGHVSPRRICTANAGAISKLMRLYRKLYGLRQICNIAVYMVHSACTIHLLNLPEKSARRDIIHGVKHLEDIADDWLCARRTLSILSVLSRKWACDLPEDAAFVLKRADEKYGYYSTSDVPSPASSHAASGVISDDSSSSKSPVDFSSLGPFSQTNMTGGIGHGPRDDRVSLMHSSQMMEEVTHRLSHHQEQSMQLDSVPLDFNSSVIGRWPGNPIGVSSPGYNSLFFPMNQRPSVPQDNQRQAVPRRMPSVPDNSTPNGQDWMLTDGARWQQNFEGWSTGGNGPPPGLLMFNDNRTNSAHQTSAARQDDQGPPCFDGLSASLSGGGWLPELD